MEIKSVILAAGKGTRMKSNTPKVLHKIFEKPLLGYVLDNVKNIIKIKKKKKKNKIKKKKKKKIKKKKKKKK